MAVAFPRCVTKFRAGFQQFQAWTQICSFISMYTTVCWYPLEMLCSALVMSGSFELVKPGSTARVSVWITTLEKSSDACSISSVTCNIAYSAL